jgi:branched-chain amino acid transport system substrate-binding protein
LIGRGRRHAGGRGAVVTIALLIIALLIAVVLPDCGGHSAPVGNRVHGRTLTVYVSVPLHGASAVSGSAVLNGARLALADSSGRVGRYRIVLKGLDDSTAQRGEWDPGQTTLNARRAIQDPTTIGYIGELDSGASAVSIPLLNRAEIAQVSPASTGAGLTVSDAGAFPGEPAKYYPAGTRTFARVVPNDGVQAAALVELEKLLGCNSTFVLDDGDVDGQDLVSSFTAAAHSGGLPIVAAQEFQPRATDYRSPVASIAQSHAGCVTLSAIADSGPARLITQLAATLPHVHIFASAGMAESTFTDPALGGIPKRLDGHVLVTVPTLGAGDYPPSGRSFLARYAAQYGPPEPDAIYGYEAMSLLLAAIARATDVGTDTPRRSTVAAALLRTRDRHGVLGTYSIDRNGDTTTRRYGVWKIARGRLVFLEAISA